MAHVRLPALALLVAMAAPAPVAATFHLLRVVEIYGGGASHPDAQYVVLRACASGQQFVAGHNLVLYRTNGSVLASATFPANLANGSDQMRVLIATSSAERAFGIGADLRIPARVVDRGGKVCFDSTLEIDCVAWGNYGALPDAAVGDPFRPSGIPAGATAERDLSIAGGVSTLDCTLADDDTDDSLNDFKVGSPDPVNNAGQQGQLSKKLLFLYGFEDGTLSGWSAVVP